VADLAIPAPRFAGSLPNLAQQDSSSLKSTSLDRMVLMEHAMERIGSLIKDSTLEHALTRIGASIKPSFWKMR